VHEKDSLQDGGAQGQSAKVLEIPKGEGLASPVGGHPRVRIEIVGIIDAAASLVVVATDHDVAKVADLVDDLVGIRTISYEIA
jgi:hypothetical protein